MRKYHSSKKLTIEEMRLIAIERGGKCISIEYINANSKLEWECKYGHRWWALPSSIKITKSWCPHCHIYLSEEICRVYLETLFNSKFIKIKPKWLMSQSGYPMELDGYSYELNMAFEHQGPHHYGDFSFINKNNKYKNISKNDELKQQILNTKNIKLIIIPELFNKTKLNDLRDLIKKECENLNITIPNDFDTKNININTAFINNDLYTMYNTIANARGGRLIKETFINSTIKAKWECENGHSWYAAPYSIKTGNWCAICSSKKLNINDAYEVALKHNGKCLSTEYKNNKTKLQWMCSNNHIWFAPLHRIKDGTWCLSCSRSKKITINEIKQIASQNSCKCLSDFYKNNSTKLEWQCVICDYKWLSIFRYVKNNLIWCPKCRKNK